MASMKPETADELLGLLGGVAGAYEDLSLRVAALENILSPSDRQKHAKELESLKRRAQNAPMPIAIEALRAKLLLDQ
jgi:hypothetical protein